MRREPVSPSSAIGSARQVAPDRACPARIASSMSWLMYAKRSTMPDDPPLERLRLVRAGVLEDPVAHLPRQVEPAAVALEPLDDAQRVLVVAEAAARRARAAARRAPARRRGRTAGGRGRGRAAIASTRSSFRRSARRDAARDARRLERVREPRAEVVALGIDEDLRLVAQPAERLRVDDAVAVALERRPQAAFLLGQRRARASRTSARRAARATAPRARARGSRRRQRPDRRSPASSGQRSPPTRTATR